MLSWGVLGPGGLMVNTVAGLLPAFGADALSVMVLLCQVSILDGSPGPVEQLENKKAASDEAAF